jgi:hypothetical protein
MLLDHTFKMKHSDMPMPHPNILPQVLYRQESFSPDRQGSVAEHL